MKIHVHVYRMVEKWELEVEASDDKEAMEEALKAVKNNDLKSEAPETEYMAIIPEKECSDSEKRARGCGQPGPDGCGEEALCSATCHTCAMGHEENAPCQWWKGCEHWEKPLKVEEVKDV